MRIEELVLASRNRKKLAELEAILGDCAVRVRPVDACPGVPEVEETGATFAENATLKAETVSAATGAPALADDSGLCVDALDGAPGVWSARFAGEEADDAANNRLLLERLRDVPPEERTAHYVCSIALAVPGQPTAVVEDRCEGRILDAPRGDGGFGYDPLFLSTDLGQTFAEADPDAKHRVSHRGRALARLAARLRAACAPGPGAQAPSTDSDQETPS